jgi:hypothetical protein
MGPKILLPGVLEQLHRAMVSPYEVEESILSGYVLNPLFEFGLIETSRPDSDCNIDKEDVIKITPLWKKFISFTWGKGAR